MQLSLSVSSWQRRIRVLLVILTTLALADLTGFSVEDHLRVAPKAPEPVTTPAAGPFGLADKDKEKIAAVLSTTAPPAGERKPSTMTASTATQTTAAASAAAAGPPPRLVGTLAGSGCQLAVLSLGNETVIAGPGKVVSGYRILTVDSWSARVRDSAGNTQVLGLELAGGTPTAQAPTPPAPTAENTPTATTGGPINLPQAQFKDMVNHSDRWISKVQLKMDRQGEEVLGARVSYVDRDNPFALVGIQTGDVIKAFNNRPLKGPDDLLWAKSELANARTFHFDILRGGAPTTLDVEIKD